MIDVAQNAPGKIHVVTRAYIAGWALPPGRVLRPVSVEHGVQKPKTSAGAGWVRDWWGKDDPALNEACEAACRPLEGLVPKLLGNVEQRWPFSDDNERGILAQFIALHIVRTEATRAWFATAREDSLRSMQEDWKLGLPSTSSQPSRGATRNALASCWR
jgi:hypothetical protein